LTFASILTARDIVVGWSRWHCNEFRARWYGCLDLECRSVVFFVDGSQVVWLNYSISTSWMPFYILSTTDIIVVSQRLRPDQFHLIHRDHDNSWDFVKLSVMREDPACIQCAQPRRINRIATQAQPRAQASKLSPSHDLQHVAELKILSHLSVHR
jgi:hypothetical protein